MRLRFEAYSADDRLTWQKTAGDMRDQWDERSLSALLSVEGRPGGSIRVTVSSDSEELSYPSPVTDDDYRRFFGLVAGANRLPHRSEYVESSRLCILPSVRGKGLWYPLAAQMVAMGCHSRRSFVVGSAIDELLPTWQRVGFERTGLRYFNHDIGGRVHEMIVLDLERVVAGKCDPKFHPWVFAALENFPAQDRDLSAILLR
jgi:hypothetical protein